MGAFIRWTKKKKNDIIAREWAVILATGIFFALGLGALSFLMTRLYQKFLYIRTMHRKRFVQDHEMINSEEEDTGMRIEQFLADAMESGGEVSGAIEQARAITFRPPLSGWDMFFMGVFIRWTK